MKITRDFMQTRYSKNFVKIRCSKCENFCISSTSQTRQRVLSDKISFIPVYEWKWRSQNRLRMLLHFAFKAHINKFIFFSIYLWILIAPYFIQNMIFYSKYRVFTDKMKRGSVGPYFCTRTVKPSFMVAHTIKDTRQSTANTYRLRKLL